MSGSRGGGSVEVVVVVVVDPVVVVVVVSISGSGITRSNESGIGPSSVMTWQKS
jgi:hypothetical protein